jgi:hypothetical protein
MIESMKLRPRSSTFAVLRGRRHKLSQQTRQKVFIYGAQSLFEKLEAHDNVSMFELDRIS